METVAMVLVVGGYIAAVVAGIWLLVVAFQTGVGWGLACLFIPLAALVFVIAHWEDAKRPFLAQLAACVPIILGAVLAPGQ
jgi:hypothetical protein